MAWLTCELVDSLIYYFLVLLNCYSSNLLIQEFIIG